MMGQESPSSVLSPLLEVDTSSFGLSLLDESINAAGAVLAAAADQESTSRKRPLLSTSSMTSAKRLRRKRKSRAKPKEPVMELSANMHNFRDIVHQFTGAPCSISTQSHHPHIPSTAQSNAAFNGDWQQGPSALSHTASLSEKDVLLAGALLAESIKTLEVISSYLILPSASHGGEHAGNAHRTVAELEKFLLTGDSKLHDLFSLPSLLLKQIAG